MVIYIYNNQRKEGDLTTTFFPQESVCHFQNVQKLSRIQLPNHRTSILCED